MPNPTMFEVPERCLLSQALLWVSRGLQPIPDEDFLAAPDGLSESDLKHRIQLIRLLRLGAFDTQSVLRAYCEPTALRSFDMDIEEIVIPQFSEYQWPDKIFHIDKMNFSKNTIDVTSDIISHSATKEMKYILSEILSSRGVEDISNEVYSIHCYFENVTIPTKSLFERFPGQPSADGDAIRDSTIAGETRCEEWLLDLMLRGDKESPKPKYLKQAKTQYAVSVNGFNRAWAAAVKRSGKSGWTKPGRIS